MRVSETILTQRPLRKLKSYVEILKALTVSDILPDIVRFLKLSKTELRDEPKFELWYAVKNYGGNILQY